MLRNRSKPNSSAASAVSTNETMTTVDTQQMDTQENTKQPPSQTSRDRVQPISEFLLWSQNFTIQLILVVIDLKAFTVLFLCLIFID